VHVNKINDEIDGRIYCCDGLLLGAIVKPSLIIKKDITFGKVETTGETT